MELPSQDVAYQKSETESTENDGHEEEFGSLTAEQIAIRDHQAKRGEIVTVNAHAGCGKTTTIGLICNNLNTRILYIVFGKANRLDAQTSAKLGKHVEVHTSHSFVLRAYFTNNWNAFLKPALVNDHKIEEIAQYCGLKEDIQKLFPELTENKSLQRINTVARSIRKTLKNFQASNRLKVTIEQVPYYSTSSQTDRTKWKSQISKTHYQRWAQQYFDSFTSMCEYIRDNQELPKGPNRRSVPHDGYMKVAQLEGVRIRNDVIMVDEAQDMTPCQARIFWGDGAEDRKTYIFGDIHQQLFRFRGASDSFKEMFKSERTTSFTLSGSFRFGKNIAEVASKVLNSVNGGNVCGLSNDDGHVARNGFKSGTVLCCTNNGMMKYLFHEKPSKWCYIDANAKKPPLKTPHWVAQLEAFLGDESEHSSFVYQEEKFETVRDLQSYGEEESDIDLLKFLDLLLFLKKQKVAFNAFESQISESYFPHSGCVDDYSGTILSTVHKAKGLEFQNVYIYDDFKFHIMMSKTVPRLRREDEINKLYVAVTRSKQNLFFSASSVKSMQKFDEFYSHEASSRLFPNFCTKREQWNVAWTNFKDSNAPIVDFEKDIPWPWASEEEMDAILLDEHMEEEQQYAHLNKLRLRYHPDKFMPKFRSRFSETQLQKDSLMSRLNDITRCVTRERKKLRDAGC
ncbi:MAG: hypothetical protein SGILL_005822 [Bacillariaceae sp.]